MPFKLYINDLPWKNVIQFKQFKIRFIEYPASAIIVLISTSSYANSIIPNGMSQHEMVQRNAIMNCVGTQMTTAVTLTFEKNNYVRNVSRFISLYRFLWKRFSSKTMLCTWAPSNYWLYRNGTRPYSPDCSNMVRCSRETNVGSARHVIDDIFKITSSLKLHVIIQQDSNIF